MILDIHTHHPAPRPLAIVDASPRLNANPVELINGQLYSAGIHPYDTITDIPEEMWTRLEELLDKPEVVAIGECGIDLSGRGGMMFRQLQVLKRQIDLSEKLRKPIILHCVKADDVICGLRRDLQPEQPWVIHGYRKNPESAALLLKCGCYLSFGFRFNEETVRSCPLDRILAETDESPESIEDIVLKLSQSRTVALQDYIIENTTRFLGLKQPDSTD